MRVTDRGTSLVIQDTPGCLWLFGTWFVVGGVLAIALPFVAGNRDDVPRWGKLAAVIMGLAAVVVGWTAMRRSPSTHTELNAASGKGRVRSRAPFGRTQVEEFDLRDIGIVQVLPSRDSEGTQQYSVRLLLSDGRDFPLHVQPSPNKRSIEGVATRIREYLGVRA